MNERIRELEKLATETVKCGLNGSYTTERFSRKKFAELIVKECVEQIYPQWIKEHDHIDPTNLADAVMRVREHFGVEE